MTHRSLVAMMASAIVLTILATGCTAQPDAIPTERPSTPAASPTTTPVPTPAPTAEAIAPTCENIVTQEYLALMSENDWVSWTPEGDDAWPFEFVGGPPTARLSCVWGSDPDIGTDNIIVLSWASLEATDVDVAQAALADEGFERIEAPEGVYYAQKGEGYWADAEGFGQSYLFTSEDVRWAMYKDELRFIKAPEQVG